MFGGFYMVFLTRNLKIKSELSNNSIDFFINNKCISEGFSKKSIFLRYIGIDSSDNDYLNMINNIYNKLGQNCMVIKKFENISDNSKINFYSDLYDKWINVSGNPVSEFNFKFPFSFNNDTAEYTMKTSFKKILDIFKSSKVNISDSIIKNFAIKIFYWIDLHFNILYDKNDTNLSFPKIIYIGNIKLQQFLFLYLLYLMGCDILYLNTESDADLPENVKKITSLYKCKIFKTLNSDIPDFKFKHNNAQNCNVDIKQTNNILLNTVQPNLHNKNELDYEKLAELSISVVMIKVYNSDSRCFKTGSGIVINNKGLILTNFHVVQGGSHFGIRFENENHEYYTSEIIKYHNINDLAVIRSERISPFLNLADSASKAVRGQKIVAIGSPLGLFNSVSDGIISGFRTIESVPMIQFTAPISNGSSGGALINLFGEVIGIITAGFDEGQNLNLAVDFKIIRSFLNGLI